MQADEADRIRVRLVISSYVNIVLYIAVWVAFALAFPWYQTLLPAVFLIWGLWRTLFRQATSISFEPGGVEVDLFFRKRHIRAPVTEFSGSRFRALTVSDLHSGKRYDLTQLLGSRKLIRAAESRGYPVLRRPNPVFQ